jgi:hypothetical protein
MGRAAARAPVRMGAGAAGGNSAGAAQGVPGLVVAREGPRGGGDVGTKRHPAALPAHHPPPKRTAVSARRQFPQCCGREAAAPLGRAGGGSRFRAAPADYSSDALDEAADAPPRPRAGSNDGVRPGTESLSSACASVIKKVSATDGAGPAAKCGHHAPAARWPAKRKILSANRSFPTGCGSDAVPLLAVDVRLMVQSGRADDGLGVSVKTDADCDCSAADEGGVDVVATPWDGAAYGAVQREELEQGEIPPAKVHWVVTENLGSQVSVNVTLHKPAACGHGASVPAIGAVEVSDEKISGSRIQCGVKRSSYILEKDSKITKNSAGSSYNVVAECPSEQLLRGKRVPEIAKMDKISSDSAAGVFSKDAMTTRKLMLTPRKKVRPAKMTHISAVNIQQSPLLENKEKEHEFGRHVKDTDEFTKDIIKQALTPSNKRPLAQDKVAATVRDYFGPKKKLKVKDPANIPIKLNYKCALGSKEMIADKVASNLEDDDVLEGLAVRQGKLELYLKKSSPVSSMKCQRKFGVQNADTRSKVKMLCRRFEIICKTITQAVDQRVMKVRRIDLATDKAIRKLPDYTKHDPIVGEIPGVEVGDIFLYRVQLAIVGLHRPFQAGIDWTKDNSGNLVAISVVASGGYPDKLSSSGELVYTGSGGKLAGRNASGDQKLERGNLALKNCIKRKSPVRVIHGFKGENIKEGSHTRAKEITTFTYDGLYHVVDYWREGQPGSKVFKYKLQRIPGQPELLHGRKTGIMS